MSEQSADLTERFVDGAIRAFVWYDSKIRLNRREKLKYRTGDGGVLALLIAILLVAGYKRVKRVVTRA